MRTPSVSAIYKSPAVSTATPKGLFSWALVAGPLSPPKLIVPFPATVVITPLETLRTRAFALSAIYKLPAESTATPWGPPNWALVAGGGWPAQKKKDNNHTQPRDTASHYAR